MSEFIIYHNPRCSKSRQTLALLEARGIEPRIIDYLKTPPTAQELKELLRKLGVNAAAIVRSKEAEYAAEDLSAASSDADLIAAIGRAPKLLERPIVVRGHRAVIGRPPENVLELL